MNLPIECVENNIPFTYQEIDNLQLFEYARNHLLFEGILKYDEMKTYCYLKIQDDFILKLFPLIKQNDIQMPNYFSSSNRIGAHISVFYPNEVDSNLKIKEIDQKFSFDIIKLFKLQIVDKTFLALTVSSPLLEQLRIRYGLGLRLDYHGLLVPFHITIAVGIKHAKSD